AGDCSQHHSLLYRRSPDPFGGAQPTTEWRRSCEAIPPGDGILAILRAHGAPAPFPALSYWAAPEPS
ncbi:MAG: hypothetical protein QOI03_1014, partial [Solirubrobacteraceae bacterium]|nr:hypothetical protein [Solirubrobacteraceae bacterium]